MMDYKKIFKSRALRLRILRLLAWVPDKSMLKIQYKIKTGRKLDLKNPRRYTEKLQWYKLHYKNSLMTQCVDKYDVREYIKSVGLERILTNCYGVYEHAEDINFEKLPDRFVIKDTLGGGGNSVIVVKDKASLDEKRTINQIKECLNFKSDVKGGGREWPYYSGKKNRIIIEEYLESTHSAGLIDYKFFCFNGKFEYMYIIGGRNMGVNAKLAVYDSSLIKLDVKRIDELPFDLDFDMPHNISEMIDIANLIASPFPHARVDLYNISGRIVFGEITFFDGSGYMKYDPDEFDFILGDKFVLPPK